MFYKDIMGRGILLFNVVNQKLTRLLNDLEADIFNTDNQEDLGKLLLDNDISIVIIYVEDPLLKKIYNLIRHLNVSCNVIAVANGNIDHDIFMNIVNNNYNMRVISLDSINEAKDIICSYMSTDNTDPVCKIIGKSSTISKSRKLAVKASKSNISVHLHGESGVGKELFAQAIHYNSDRADKPFVTINCGAIPANLVESVLFGHEKGAFTGAYKRSLGKFVEANNGTIFLDEIGELQLDMQVKLLRVLQESEVEPIGSSEKYKINVRIISATNKDLEEEVKLGNFREDLLYRLNVFPIEIPSLKNRIQDIALIAEHYCREFASKEKINIHSITKEAVSLLKMYDWPGNVRELKNIIYRAIIMSDSSEQLDIDDIKKILGDKISYSNTQIESKIEYIESKHKSLEYIDHNGDFIALDDLESKIIRNAIEYYGGNMSKAAEKLGIGRSTIYRKLNNPNSNRVN